MEEERKLSSSKMEPKLNTEILYGILQEFGDGKEESSQELIKFMLTGRESCRAFFDYFSKATQVNFRAQTLELVVMNKNHCFGYDWEFSDLVLKVAISSINHLSIFECPVSERGFEILDQFLKPDLAHLTLFAPVPSHYMDFFKDNCNFESVYSQHLYPHNASVLDVFTVPSEEHKVLFASYMDFVRAIPFLSNKHSIAEAGFGNNITFAPTEIYPAVKKLVLVPCNHSLGVNYSLTSEVLLFPSLQSVTAKFQAVGPWRNSIDNFLEFSSLTVSPVVKANISFILIDNNGSLVEVLHFKESNPEIIFNENDATISKSYFLEDGSFIQYVIKFGGTDLVTDNNVVADGQNNVALIPEFSPLIRRVLYGIYFAILEVITSHPLRIYSACRMFPIFCVINWFTAKDFGYTIFNKDHFVLSWIFLMVVDYAENVLQTYPQIMVTLNIPRWAAFLLILFCLIAFMIFIFFFGLVMLSN